MGAGETDLSCTAGAEAKGPHSPQRGLEPGCARGQPHPLLKCCGRRHFCSHGVSVTLALSALLLGSHSVGCGHGAWAARVLALLDCRHLYRGRPAFPTACARGPGLPGNSPSVVDNGSHLYREFPV